MKEKMDKIDTTITKEEIIYLYNIAVQGQLNISLSDAAVVLENLGKIRAKLEIPEAE